MGKTSIFMSLWLLVCTNYGPIINYVDLYITNQWKYNIIFSKHDIILFVNLIKNLKES